MQNIPSFHVSVFCLDVRFCLEFLDLVPRSGINSGYRPGWDQTIPEASKMTQYKFWILVHDLIRVVFFLFFEYMGILFEEMTAHNYKLSCKIYRMVQVALSIECIKHLAKVFLNAQIVVWHDLDSGSDKAGPHVRWRGNFADGQRNHWRAVRTTYQDVVLMWLALPLATIPLFSPSLVEALFPLYAAASIVGADHHNCHRRRCHWCLAGMTALVPARASLSQ